MAAEAGKLLTASYLDSLIAQVAYGSESINLAAGGFVNVPVVFLTPFPAAPHINVTSSSGRYNVAAASITTTGFTLSANNWTTAGGGTVPVNWQAIEKL